MNNFQSLVYEFKAKFDFERYNSCPEPTVLELDIQGYNKIILDGMRPVLICSKSHISSKVADIVINTEDKSEFLFKIVLGFDLEPKVIGFSCS